MLQADFNHNIRLHRAIPNTTAVDTHTRGALMTSATYRHLASDDL